jgi:hypothetical protein
MPERLALDNNAIVIPTADLSFRSGIKVMIHKVVAVCTPNYLFAIPTKVISASLTGRARQGGETPAGAVVEELANKPEQTLEGLEQDLLALSEGQENAAFKLADLKAYKLKGWGPFRQFGIWKQGQLMPMAFIPRGKGEMKRFEAFCAKRVPAKHA